MWSIAKRPFHAIIFYLSNKVFQFLSAIIPSSSNLPYKLKSRPSQQAQNSQNAQNAQNPINAQNCHKSQVPLFAFSSSSVNDNLTAQLEHHSGNSSGGKNSHSYFNSNSNKANNQSSNTIPNSSISQYSNQAKRCVLRQNGLNNGPENNGPPPQTTRRIESVSSQYQTLREGVRKKTSNFTKSSKTFVSNFFIFYCKICISQILITLLQPQNSKGQK